MDGPPDTAAGGDGIAGDSDGKRRSEEGDDAGDVFGLDDALDGVALGHAFLGLVEGFAALFGLALHLLFHELGPGEAGVHAGDVDAERAEFVGEVFGERGYRLAHHEAGYIGQQFYLNSHALGLDATGIGCFIDDAINSYIELPAGFEVIYNFTFGSAINDPRLTTLPAYDFEEQKKQNQN